jgi:hypothetical protein
MHPTGSFRPEEKITLLIKALPGTETTGSHHVYRRRHHARNAQRHKVVASSLVYLFMTVLKSISGVRLAGIAAGSS